MDIISNISSYIINNMKDINGNIITEEEFIKNIGHGTVGYMKEQIKR